MCMSIHVVQVITLMPNDHEITTLIHKGHSRVQSLWSKVQLS